MSSSEIRSQAAHDLRVGLNKVPAAIVELNRDLVSIPSNMPIAQAFKLLIESKILSAPVYEKDSSNFVGFLDTRDLLAFCCFAYDDNNLIPSLEEIVHHGAKRVAVAITAVTPAYLARRHRFSSVNESSTLAEAADKLARSDTHRIPVVDKSGDLSSIVTQSAIVKYLYDHKDDFKLAMQSSVKELELGSSPVVCVNKDAVAAEVFEIMDKKGLSGVGITDADGKIIANTSASDSKLFLDSMESLGLPIMEFLRRIYKDMVDVHAPLVCVSPSASLEEVVGKMSVARVHRVFVVDADSMPLSVISVTDLMKLVASVSF